MQYGLEILCELILSYYYELILIRRGQNTVTTFIMRKVVLFCPLLQILINIL